MDDFTIIGGGVAGLTAAHALMQDGHSVRIIDHHQAPGTHNCSWWAGGMLAPECEGVITEPAVVKHGRKAAAWWAHTGVQLSHFGTLVLALGRDQRELKSFARRCERAEWQDETQISKQEPDLETRFSKGLFIENEAHLDPRSALASLHQKLTKSGVSFIQEQSQTCEELAAQTGHIIDCRGLAAQDELSDLRGVKGEMLILHCPDLHITRPIRLLHPRFPLYIVPRGNGYYMLGATQIESQDRSSITARSLMELLNAAYALHPAFAEASIVEIGVDARPAFHDNLPRIRRTQHKTYINGLFRHGFLLAPSLAVMTAKLLTSEEAPEDFYEDHR